MAENNPKKQTNEPIRQDFTENDEVLPNVPLPQSEKEREFTPPPKPAEPSEISPPQPPAYSEPPAPPQQDPRPQVVPEINEPLAGKPFPFSSDNLNTPLPGKPVPPPVLPSEPSEPSILKNEKQASPESKSTEDVFTPPQMESSLPESYEEDGVTRKKSSGVKLFLIIFSLAILIIGAVAVYFLVLVSPEEPVIPIIPTVETTVSLSIVPETILEGESATLVWSSQNATICESDDFETDSETSGEIAVFPTGTTLFILACEDDDGNQFTSEATLVVEVPEISEPTTEEYNSLFVTTDGTGEINLSALSLSSVSEGLQAPLNPDFFESGEIPVGDYIIDFGLIYENRLLKFTDVMEIVMPEIFSEEIAESLFDEKISLFAYYDQGTIWPGIVVRFSENIIESDAAEEAKETIKTLLEEDPALLAGAFYENPGVPSEWKDGNADGIATRFIVFSNPGSAFNYGWVSEGTLIMTSSYPAFLKALASI